jgi:two-component system heavy metal sensor histidine kinase CusS
MNFYSFLSNLNIRQRLTLQFLLLVSVLFVFFSIGIYLFSKLYLTNRFYNRLQERAVITGSLYIDLSANQKAILELVRKGDNQALAEEMVSIYYPETNSFVFSSDFVQRDFHRRFINPQDTSQTINNIEYKGLKASVLKISDYWVVISAKDNTEKEALRDLRDILVIMGIVALLFIAYISWFVAGHAMAPIARIGKELEIIFPQNLSKRVSYVGNNDEISALSNTINQLLKRVEEAVSTQKMFVANISHELKNPLTKIFMQIEILEMKYRDIPEYYEKILSLRSDTLTLNQLTHSLLELANINSSESELPKKNLRVDEVLFDSISEFKRWNPDLNVNPHFENFPESEEVLEFMANEDALKIVFKNLMDNACKFSNNQSADIYIYEEKGILHISIYNEGNPIPKEEVPKILQPFFRSDSTAKGKKGHGVGLAIVKQILRAHKIKLIIEPSEKGNYFILVFHR